MQINRAALRTPTLLLAAVSLMAIAAYCVFGADDQFVTKTLEDCEAALSGWPSQAEVVDDASQGEAAIRWTPPAGSGPHFFRFDFSDRNVELSEWDRLVFDYKFTKPGCNWWGVKIVDYPLGKGMQATWRIADANGLTPGTWQTATIELHKPQWLWGDDPNETSQTITFRCQFNKNATSAILIDDVRLLRYPIRIEAFTAADVVRKGDTLSRSYTLSVHNTTQQPVGLRIEPRDAAPGLTFDIDRPSVTVPPGQTETTEVRIACPVAGDDVPDPLTALAADIAVKPMTISQKEMTRSVSLTVPLERIPHPSLLVTAEQAEHVMARVKTNEDAKNAYEGLKRRADAWLEKTVEFPEEGGQWWHWYTCKECGARLKTEGPHRHVCPDCGEVYSGWPYDQVVLNRKHDALSHAIRDLGLMYALTGEDQYAAKAREILRGYAERYLDYPLHNIRGEPSKGGGHVGPQTLDESTWLIPVAQGFDCIYETLSPDDIDFIAEKMLLPAANLIHDHQWGIHNICCWHASAYGLVGLTLGNQQLISDAIAGPKGFRSQVEEGITDDGFWYESSWGYHFYTMMALEPLAAAAYNVGIDLYTERYKGMYDAPLQFMAPGGTLPAFNDSGRTTAIGRGNRYEIAYARWRDPQHLLPIMNSNRGSLQTLLYGVELGQTEPFQLGSTVFPTAGYVILRSGESGTGDIGSHIPRNYLAFDYGPHGGGHGHPDKLGFVLYGNGELLAEDPGSIAYGNPAHKGWYKQTISHSTVAVNQHSQSPCTGTLQFSAFAGNMGICSAGADDAYPNATLRRTLALIDDRVIDVYLCEADEPVTFDWAYHNRGALDCDLQFSEIDSPADAQGYEWAEDWQGADAAGPWSAIWQQADGPGLMLTQAAVGEGTRQVLKAVGMGNPPRVKVPFVVSRQRAQSALYCSALQIFADKPPAELNITQIPAARDGDDGNAAQRPVAVEVSGDGARDVLLVNPGGGRMSAGRFELDGQAALLRYKGGQLADMLVVSDGKVSVDGRPVAPPAG